MKETRDQVSGMKKDMPVGSQIKAVGDKPVVPGISNPREVLKLVDGKKAVAPTECAPREEKRGHHHH
jgi:hypothetical protein